MALEEGDSLQTLKSLLKAEKYYFGFTYQVFGALDIYKDGTVSDGGGMLMMEEQKRKSPSMLNLFILIKRSKNTKGKAEHI